MRGLRGGRDGVVEMGRGSGCGIIYRVVELVEEADDGGVCGDDGEIVPCKTRGSCIDKLLVVPLVITGELVFIAETEEELARGIDGVPNK